MKKITQILLYAIFPVAVTGQLYSPQNISHLSSCKLGDQFTSSLNTAFNPSILPSLESFEAAFYAEKKFMTDIHLILLSIAIPFNKNGIGLHCQYFGNSSFSERVTGLSYGKDLGKVSVGILFRHINVRIDGSPNISGIQTGIATSLKLSGNVYAGIKLIRPVFISADDMKPSPDYSFILCWQSSSISLAGIELSKPESRPLTISFTLQYQFSEKYYGGLHWNTSSHQPFVLIGWKLNAFNVEAGGGYHPVLGASPSISFLYKHNK